jgi:hypothetical protein
MQFRRAFVVLVAIAPLAACGSDSSSPAPGDSTNDGGGGTSDSGGAADGGGSGDAAQTIDAGDSGGGDAGAPGFVIQTPQIAVAAGEDVIKCFYLHVPNTTDVAVKTWKSTKSAGVGHAALLFTTTDVKAPGTVSADGCGMGSGSPPAAWAYSAYKAQDGWSFPSDDGAGKPVARTVKAAQPAFVLMHLTNATAAPIDATVTIEGIGYAAGTATTAAEPYVTFKSDISIPGSATNDVESYTCDVPAGSKIAWLTTLSRKRSTSTKVSTGGTAIFTGTNWEDPGSLVGAAPFKTFAGDKVNVECTYSNGSGATVTSGDTVADETCMMLAHVFPATKPRICFNGTLLP